MRAFYTRLAVIILALLIMTSFISFTIGERSAWDCPGCGRTGNTGNFCGGCGHPAPPTGPSKKLKIGIAFPTDSLQRWVMDGKSLKSKLESEGHEILLMYCDNDTNIQISRIQEMIDRGCNVLIIASVDVYSLNDVLQTAKRKGIQVIAFDRLIMDTDAVSYYISFENTRVGEMQGNYIRDALDLEHQSGPFNLEISAGEPSDLNSMKFYDGAMSVLRPYINSGKLKVKSGQIEYEQVTTSLWKTDIARQRAEDILISSYTDGTTLDAWLCVNDSTACGVIEALNNHYHGQWPVITGQDCDRQNVKYIINGKQSMSVLKLTSNLTEATVKIIKQVSNGTKVETNSSVNNGEIEIPTYQCDPVVIDQGNYSTYLIKTGLYTEEELR